MIKVIELFAGIGSQTQALKNIGVEHEVIGISEIDKYAITSYEAIHGKTHNFGDISKIEALPYCDLLTYSFPCFTKHSLVLTENGYKSIEKIKVGEKVLTHKNRYMKVSKTFKNGYKNIFKLTGMAFDEIKTTENHKFLVREKYKEWDNNKRKYERKFKEQEWKEIKYINKDCYLGLSINQNSKIPNWDGVYLEWSDGRKTRHKNDLSKFMAKKVFWWLIGRYLADGWTKQNGIILAIGKHKSKEFEEKLKENFKYTKIEERTAFKYHFSSKELSKYVSQFGKGASNKKLTKDIFDLPIDLLKSFLDGYLSGDGCVVKNVIKCSSVSRELIYGIGHCISKVYKRPYSIYKVKKPKSCIIEGRTVNQQSYFNLNFKKEKNKQDKAFYEDGYVWFPIQAIENIGIEEVFDIEVESDHSFTVQNVIVHNCQDLSISGKQKGIEKGTRSGLLFEVERLLEISESKNKLPKYLLLENVKNLVGKNFKKDFDKWLNFLEGLGYSNFWQVLNAKDYGIPQNRERVFVVSILKNTNYTFPIKKELKLYLKDFLEEEVEDKYFLPQDKIEKLKFNPNTKTGKTEIKQIGNLVHTESYGGNPQRGRVYCPEGTSPTLNTVGGGGLEPKIIQKSRGFNKGGIKKLTPTITTSVWQENNFLAINKNKKILGNINPSGKGMNGNVYNIDSLSPTLTTNKGEGIKLLIKNDTKKGFMQTDPFDSIDLDFPNSETRRGRVKKGYSSTLTTQDNTGVLTKDYKIRKLTPLECWRLMGFVDEDFYKAKNALNKKFYKGKDKSKTQLYKQAGNSIVVQVLEGIFRELFLKTTEPKKHTKIEQLSFFKD